MELKRKIIISFFLVIFLLIPGNIKADSQDIEVEIVNPRTLETYPGRLFTISLKVNSDIDEHLNLKEDISLPEGWKLVSVNDIFELKSKETCNRLLSIIIPRNTLVNDYTIKHKLVNSENGSIYNKLDIPVDILPLYNLSIESRNSIPFMIAGNDYEINFDVYNNSNVELDINLEATSNNATKMDFRNNNFILKPGEYKVVDLILSSYSDINKTTKDFIKVIAEGKYGEEAIVESKTVFVDILPKITGSLDKYYRLPGYLKTNLLYDNNNLYIHPEFKIEGFLDKEETKKIDFIYNGKKYLIKGFNSIMEYEDLEEELRFKYISDQLEFNLGDIYFRHSPLEDIFSNGRGVDILYKEQQYQCNLNYFKDDNKFEYKNIFLKQYLNNDTDLIYSYGQKSDDNSIDKERIIGIGADTLISDKEEISIRLGKGLVSNDNGFAFKGQLSGSTNDLDYTLTAINADTDFLGKYRDSNIGNLKVSFPFNDFFSLSASYRKEFKNLDKNIFYDDYDKKDEYNIGANINYNDHGRFRLSYTNSKKLDTIDLVSVDALYKSYDLSFNHILNKTTLSGKYRYEEDLDNLSQTISNKNSIALSLLCKPIKYHNYKLYYYRDNLWGSEEEGIEAGLKADWRISKNLLALGVAVIEREQENRYYELKSSLQHEFDQDTSIKLNGTYKRDMENNSKNTEFNFLLSKSFSFGIPIAHRDTCVVEGKVYNKNTEKKDGIKNVIIRINEHTAVTDEKGNFIFPDLKAGEYYLQIDHGVLGNSMITDIITPYKIELQKKEEMELDIGLISSAHIEGKIKRYDYKHKGVVNQDNSTFVENGGFGNLIVLLYNKDESYKSISNQDGEFKFNNIRPGKWSIKVLNSELLLEHYIEEEEYIIEIESSENKDIIIKAIPK
ncbi:MAG: hypothetical protein ACOCRO_04300, partial [Halanaerobiales bacterium]